MALAISTLKINNVDYTSNTKSLSYYILANAAITKVKGAIFDVIDVKLTYISIHGFRSGALIKQITGYINTDLPQWYNKIHRCLV